MADLFTPFQQFLDKNADPLSKGTLKFLKEGTTDTLLDTFSDSALLNKNTNPVVLDGEGRLPNLIFGKGVYNVILRSKATTLTPDGVLIDQLDPIGGSSGAKSPFDPYDESTIYNIPDIVLGSDGKFYKSLTNGNFNNDPILDPGDNEFWEEFKLRGVWNAKITYAINDVVQTVTGNLWKSLTASNLNNNPDTDDGTNWANAIDDLPKDIATATNLVASKSYISTVTASHVVPAASGGASIKITWLDGTIMTLTSSSNISVTTNIKTTDTTWVFQNFISTLTLIDTGTEWEIK